VSKHQSMLVPCLAHKSLQISHEPGVIRTHNLLIDSQIIRSSTPRPRSLLFAPV
jgi:hypothetical protein